MRLQHIITSLVVFLFLTFSTLHLQAESGESELVDRVTQMHRDGLSADVIAQHLKYSGQISEFDEESARKLNKRDVPEHLISRIRTVRTSRSSMGNRDDDWVEGHQVDVSRETVKEMNKKHAPETRRKRIREEGNVSGIQIIRTEKGRHHRRHIRKRNRKHRLKKHRWKRKRRIKNHHRNRVHKKSRFHHHRKKRHARKRNRRRVRHSRDSRLNRWKHRRRSHKKIRRHHRKYDNKHGKKRHYRSKKRFGSSVSTSFSVGSARIRIRLHNERHRLRKRRSHHRKKKYKHHTRRRSHFRFDR